MTDLEKVHKLAHILDMKKARNIIALDLGGATIIADYFVICSAGSPAQMHALYDAACEQMLPPRKVRGHEKSRLGID